MHGIVNRGLQCFVTDVYGGEQWFAVCDRANLPMRQFETMLRYDDLVTEQLLEAMEFVLGRTRATLLEDFGTFVVSEHSSPKVRKLLRLGGQTYVEFLHSLEDLNDRLALALPDLETPSLVLFEQPNDQFILSYEFHKEGFGAVFLGVLRAMADDYGELVVIEHDSRMVEGISKDRFVIKLVDHPLQGAQDVSEAVA